MALTAITGNEGAQPQNRKTVNEKRESSGTDESVVKLTRKREDIVDLKKEVTQENQSAQKSAQVGAEQLLGKIDLSA